MASITAVGAFAAVLIGIDVAEPGSARAADSCRTIPVDADPVLRSDLARLDFGVDGTGVTVGVISNSFFLTSANSTPDQNVADGLLPGPGNPCGYLTPVEVALEAPLDLPDPDDEGRGMAELVHGVAPGARIVFASAETDGGMEAALNELKTRGVDIIVDDMSVYDESWFQQSATSQAVASLVDEGITYFSAAANETVLAQNPPAGTPSTPVNGWRTSAYRPVPCEPPLETYIQGLLPNQSFDCMDFDHGSGVDTVDTITADLTKLIQAPATATDLDAWLQWAEPFHGVETGFQLFVGVTDLQNQSAYVYTETEVVDSPVSALELTLDPAQFGDTVDLDISLVRYTEQPLIGKTPPIGFMFTANGPQWIDAAEYWESNEHDTIGRTITGHNAAPGAITVAATNGEDDDRIDFYSSLGPVTYYLSPEDSAGDAQRYDVPQTTNRPEIMSVDNVRNSVLGYATDTPGVLTFPGTSAASPNAAAVAALALEVNPSLKPADIRRLLVDTARRLPSPYPTVPESDSVGAGLIDAYAMLEAVPPVEKARLASTGTESPVGILAAAGLLTLAGVLLSRRRRVTA